MTQSPPPGLVSEVAALDWYHTLELAPGLVTPGWFDTRALPARLPLPPDLTGQRCLDVGTFDGFWAFELERRGAGEVQAIDVLDPDDWDWPAGSAPATVATIGARKAGGRGFELARRALGSGVQRSEKSVYELDPAHDGTFDFVYLGSLLLHLRDPVGALARVRAVCRGQLLVVDAYDPLLSRLSPRRPLARLDGVGRPWWWTPNLAALERMLAAAGLEAIGVPLRLTMPAGAGAPRTGSWRARRFASRGEPHAALLARPSPA